MKSILLLLTAFLVALPAWAGTDVERWWPTQKFPKSVVRTTSQLDFPAPRLALQMMVQSVAGLAAQAVNEGRGDELVWVYNGEGDLEQWYALLAARHPGLTAPGALTPWALVDRYAQLGLIKGYILYRAGPSARPDDATRTNLDCSINVATSLAGLLQGIIVDEELEPAAQAHGLKRLLDARDKSPAWCFQTYQSQFNHHLLCLQDPRRPHARDLAIAQKVFTTYGHDGSDQLALAWLDPLSPIIGVNQGDEYVNTDLSTRCGDLQTSTDWCLNLPVLMAGSGQLSLPQAKNVDPRTIDWSDTRSAVAFITTDGDNVQWLMGNFCGNPDYWGNPERGKIPFGWSSCFSQLAQLCPETIQYLQSTRTPNDSVIEWGGGYYYPDHFASERTNRWELLARQARRTWELMRTTNTRLLGFNFTDVDSPAARQACAVIAGQTDGLLAILAFQYSPYEAGAGKVYWVRDRLGVDVPVITARYSLWEHANDRARAGTPAKVAREIQQAVAATAPAQLPRYDWVIAHVWSRFQRAPGSDEDAENLPPATAEPAGAACGYTPVTWCAERLPAGIRVVSPEELVWRIRLQHDPVATKKLMANW